MSSLFAALGNAGNALTVLEQAMAVVQNNVANAQTPGYVTQTIQINSGMFDPAHGYSGGIMPGGVQSSRNLFAENSVWSANEQLGSATAQSSSLQNLQQAFNVTGSSGIPGALSQLYSAFSAWSSSPSGATAQQQVINAAQTLAQAVNSTAANTQAVGSQAQLQTQTAVTQINQLSSQIAAINGEIQSGNSNNAGLDAQLYNNLESLSNLVNISVQTHSDGSVDVLLGGQVSLVNDTTAHALSVQNTNSGNANTPPVQQILSNGQDVTSKVGAGQLGGLLQVTNSIVPSLLGSATQQGTLNQLAQGIADRVNGLLTQGVTPSGAQGTPLFAYTSTPPSQTLAAQSLSVVPGFTASQLAPATAGPPAVSNGIADKLAGLQTPSSPSDTINGMSFTDFYSSIASNVGALASASSQNKSAQTQVLAQAQSARGQASGVSLNDQAALLLQYQNAYQASAQAFSTIRSTLSYFLQSIQSA